MKILSLVTAIIILLLFAAIAIQNTYDSYWIHSPKLVDESEAWLQKRQADVNALIDDLLDGVQIEDASDKLSHHNTSMRKSAEPATSTWLEAKIQARQWVFNLNRAPAVSF